MMMVIIVEVLSFLPKIKTEKCGEKRVRAVCGGTMGNRAAGELSERKFEAENTAEKDVSDENNQEKSVVQSEEVELQRKEKGEVERQGARDGLGD